MNIDAEKQYIESVYSSLLYKYNAFTLTSLSDYKDNYILLKDLFVSYNKLYTSFINSSSQELVDFCTNDPKYSEIIQLCLDKLSI